MWSLDDANVGIKVETKNFNSVGNEILDIELLTQFIYLTQDEKLKFKNLPLEYVIEQPEKVDSKLLDKNRFKVNLTKTHFIKYLLSKSTIVVFFIVFISDVFYAILLLILVMFNVF